MKPLIGICILIALPFCANAQVPQVNGQGSGPEDVTFGAVMGLSPKEKISFGSEVRNTLLANPEIVDNALNPPAPDIYADAAKADLVKLAQEKALFSATPRGIGAKDPTLTIVFFESYPCVDCGPAWADLEHLAKKFPQLRIEPRFANESGAAQLLLSILDRQGPAAYHDARKVLFTARDRSELDAIVQDRHWVQDRMYRRQPSLESASYNRFELTRTPSYVLPHMMFQGPMPTILLEKYVKE